MRWIVLGALGVTLTACEAVHGNSEFVSVTNSMDPSSALPRATEWCAKYGKVPKMTTSDYWGGVYSYDCVKPQ